MQALRQLSIFLWVLLFILPGFAEEAAPEHKQKEFLLLPKDIYFQPGGGIRVRYENLREGTGKSFPGEEDESRATHRAQFDFKLYKGEYFETFFRFLHFAQWGASTGDTNAGQKDGFTGNNGLLVNQAWGLWKIDNSLGLKFGRAPIVVGRGLTYGENDWFNVPYSFDQFAILWDWESVELGIIAAKAQELSSVANQTLSPDPEENHIIIDVDVKNMSDAINIFNFHFAQVNRDLGSDDGGTTVLNGLNMQRFGLDVDMKGRNFLASLFLSYVTGEERVADINKANPATDPEKLNIKQLAADIELGYKFPDANELHFWGGYHFDSGNDRAPLNSAESKDYDSFYYDVYGQSGLMDFLRWGNLSYYRLGLDVNIFTGFNIGAEWLSFSKTEAQGDVHFGDAGRYMNSKIQSNDITLGASKDLGNEFDIWMDNSFTSGVKIRTTLAVFFPGQAFEQATTTSGTLPSSTVYQVLTQVGYFF